MQFSRVIIKYEKIHTYKCTNIADMMASKRFKNRIAHIEVEMQTQNEQDPVSNIIIKYKRWIKYQIQIQKIIIPRRPPSSANMFPSWPLRGMLGLRSEKWIKTNIELYEKNGTLGHLTVCNDCLPKSEKKTCDQNGTLQNARTKQQNTRTKHQNTRTKQQNTGTKAKKFLTRTIMGVSVNKLLHTSLLTNCQKFDAFEKLLMQDLKDSSAVVRIRKSNLQFNQWGGGVLYWNIF